MQTAIRLTIGLAVSAICLYFATRNADWDQVRGVLSGAHPGWTLTVVLVSIGTHWLRAQRWRVLLRPLGDVSMADAFAATLVGFGASMVLPLRLGEFVRPAYLGRRTGLSIAGALSSVVLERLFDMLLVILCFLLVGFVYPVPAYLRTGAAALAGVASLGFALLILMQRRRDLAERLIGGVLGLLPASAASALRPVADGIMNGLAGLADLSTVLRVLGYSAYLWGVIILTFLTSFLALGIDVPLLAASLTVMVIVAAFVFLPQGPGFVGTWQAGCVLALGLFGVSENEAIGYSILTWITQLVVNVGGAAFFLSREDAPLKQLLRPSPAESA